MEAKKLATISFYKGFFHKFPIIRNYTIVEMRDHGK
jgi:hypothetical protein